MQDQNLQTLLAQLIQTLPGPNAKVHPDDPFIDSVFLGQMFKAQTIRSMTKLQDAVEQLSMTADNDPKRSGKKGKAEATAGPELSPDSPGVLSGLHPSSPACNFKESFSLYLEAQAASPEELYRGQIQSMKNMGFHDTDGCIQALHANEGNLSKAVSYLMKQ